MRKKLIIILTILIIFNLILSSFLVLNIQVFESPKTSVEVNIVEINSEEIVLETVLNLKNPNNFDISLDNFELVSKTEDGKEIGRIKIKGGDVSGGDSKTFSSKNSFILKDGNIERLENKISGEIGVKFLGFIKKTLPFEILVKTSLEEILNQISQPDIKISSELTNVYEEGLNFTTKVDFSNPTDFSFDVKRIILTFEKEDGSNVGKITVNGETIEPKKSVSISSAGNILFEALDAEVLWINLKAETSVRIAGITKNVNITTNASLTIPDLKEFVFENNKINFEIPVQFKLTLSGVLSNVGFRMFNPSNFSLVGKELMCSIYRLDGEQKSLLGQKTMENCDIAPQETVCVKTNITIPYLKYLTSGKGKIIPDWIILTIEGDFHIAGTRQSVPLSLNAYVDPNIINQNKCIFD